MIKLINYIKCKILNKHEYINDRDPKSRIHIYVLRLLTCKHCGKKEFR